MMDGDNGKSDLEWRARSEKGAVQGQWDEMTETNKQSHTRSQVEPSAWWVKKSLSCFYFRPLVSNLADG